MRSLMPSSVECSAVSCETQNFCPCGNWVGGGKGGGSLLSLSPFFALAGSFVEATRTGQGKLTNYMFRIESLELIKRRKYSN